jgi:hypothetical protein
LRSDCLSRHGAGRCDRIVRTPKLVYSDDVFAADILGSDYTGSQTKLPKILLNGNNICMVGHQALLPRLTLTSGQLIPGGEGPVATAT